MTEYSDAVRISETVSLVCEELARSFTVQSTFLCHGTDPQTKIEFQVEERKVEQWNKKQKDVVDHYEQGLLLLLLFLFTQFLLRHFFFLL